MRHQTLVSHSHYNNGDIVEVPKTRFQACDALQTTLHAVNTRNETETSVQEYVEISCIIGSHVNNGHNVCTV